MRNGISRMGTERRAGEGDCQGEERGEWLEDIREKG